MPRIYIKRIFETRVVSVYLWHYNIFLSILLKEKLRNFRFKKPSLDGLNVFIY